MIQDGRAEDRLDAERRDLLAPWRKRFYALPRSVRFAIVGLGGVAIGFVVYNLIYWLNPLEPRATTSWAIASVVGVWRQHGLHRIFTFNDRRAGYAKSLGVTYVAYSVSIVASIAVNWWLTQVAGVHHLAAWFLCLGSSVAFNYIMLERVAFRAPSSNHVPGGGEAT